MTEENENMEISALQMLSQGRDKKIEFLKQNGLASVLADMVNSTRLDHKQIAENAGEDIEVQRMTNERSAEILVDLMSTNPDLDDLTEVAEEFQVQRNEILREQMDEEEFDNFLSRKANALQLLDKEDIE